MAKLESTVTIARSVEEVFRFFLDLDTNAMVVVRLNPDPVGASSCSRRSSPESGSGYGTRGWRE